MAGIETLQQIANWAWLLVAGGGGVGLLSLRSHNREARAAAKKAEAEARRKECEGYEIRIEELHKQINAANKSNTEYAERVARLNQHVDEKIERIRQLTDAAYESERNINRLNEQLVALTAELGNQRMLAEHYKTWLCRKGDCADRQPPHPELAGLKYETPKKQTV